MSLHEVLYVNDGLQVLYSMLIKFVHQVQGSLIWYAYSSSTEAVRSEAVQAAIDDSPSSPKITGRMLTSKATLDRARRSFPCCVNYTCIPSF